MSRMLNNTKVLIFIIAILLIANIAILIFFLGAKHPPQKNDHNAGNRPKFSEFLKNDIKFSQAQLKEYDSIKKVHWKTARPIFNAMNAAKDSLYFHLRDSIVSDQFLLEATDSIAQRQKQMDLQMFVHFRNMRNLCTPEQKPLFDSLVQDLIRKMTNSYRRDGRPPKPEGKDKKADSSVTSR